MKKYKIAGREGILDHNLRVLRSVDHPNIIKVFEIYEDATYIHLVMELCTGNDLLEKILAKVGLSERSTRQITRLILSAVSHLHT
jgi:calcium-dependent protein kinase